MTLLCVTWLYGTGFLLRSYRYVIRCTSTTTSSTQVSTQTCPLVDVKITMDFIDEYKLLYTIKAKDDKPAVLVMMDTEYLVTTTSFCLPIIGAGGGVRLVLEKDVHTKPYTTQATSFHDDPKQCLIVLTKDCGRYLAFPVRALLRHHKPGKCSQIEWNVWGGNVATPSGLMSSYSKPIDTWVSGCRLFATFYEQRVRRVWVYDFSEEGQERHLESKPDPEPGDVRSLGRAGEKSYPHQHNFLGGTRDSLVVFIGVSATVSLSLLERAK